MSEHNLPDSLEQLEQRAEAVLDAATKDLPPGKFRCYCGGVFDLSQAYAAYNSPYAPPICQGCAGVESK